MIHMKNAPLGVSQTDSRMLVDRVAKVSQARSGPLRVRNTCLRVHPAISPYASVLFSK